MALGTQLLGESYAPVKYIVKCRKYIALYECTDNIIGLTCSLGQVGLNDVRLFLGRPYGVTGGLIKCS